MQFIETIRENDQVTDHYLCTSKQVLKRGQERLITQSAYRTRQVRLMPRSGT